MTQIARAEWLPAGNLATARMSHTATLLNNGKVLVTGGTPSAVAHDGITSCELFDPSTLTVSPAAPLHEARAHHDAVKLPDGKVLVAGGAGPGGEGAAWNLRSCEIYDPASDTWNLVAPMNESSARHSLVLLDSGKVLRVCGSTPAGEDRNTCELYDPAADRWTYTGSTSEPAYGRACVKLTNGHVLAAGGYNFTEAVEEYDSETGEWTLRGNLSYKVSEPAAARLEDGRVLITGGEYWEGHHFHRETADLFYPETGAVIPGPSMLVGRAAHQLVTLPGGDVLAIGGASSNANYATTETCDRFVAATGTWVPGPPLNLSRMSFRTILTSDTLFVFGGGVKRPGTNYRTASIERLPLKPGLIYSQDFASYPGWTTDDPGKLGWDVSKTFHGYQINSEGTYAYIHLPRFNPNRAWRLEWDHSINACGPSAGLTFGIMDERIRHPYGAGLDMSIGDMGNETALWGSGPVSTPAWQVGVWYHSILRYDPATQELSLAVASDTAGVTPVFLTRTAVSFPANTTRLGVSRVHRKGVNGGVNPSAAIDYSLDNVRLYGEAAPVLDLTRSSGLVLTGTVGTTYHIEYADALGASSDWRRLRTLTLTNSPTAQVDLGSTNPAQRFYRATAAP